LKNSIFIAVKKLLNVVAAFLISMAAFSHEPVTPGASAAAKVVMKYTYNISGRYILAGQNDFPDSGSEDTLFASEYIGETPPALSQYFGFAAEGDKNSCLARPEILRNDSQRAFIQQACL
jgi:hypothetical protein